MPHVHNVPPRLFLRLYTSILRTWDDIPISVLNDRCIITKLPCTLADLSNSTVVSSASNRLFSLPSLALVSSAVSFAGSFCCFVLFASFVYLFCCFIGWFVVLFPYILRFIILSVVSLYSLSFFVLFASFVYLFCCFIGWFVFLFRFIISFFVLLLYSFICSTVSLAGSFSCFVVFSFFVLLLYPFICSTVSFYCFVPLLLRATLLQCLNRR